MARHQIAPTPWLIPDWPAPARVVACCTLRTGGYSATPYDSLNLGDHVGDAVQTVARNRALLQARLGVRPVFLNQVHGTELLQLDASTPDGQKADGAFTSRMGLACTVMVADCLPVMLCDTQGSMVAVVHAGWRGLVGVEGLGIIERICEQFAAPALVKYSKHATDLIAWLGPCIGPGAFEVGDEVLQGFVRTDPLAAQCFTPHSAGKWLADLAGLTRQRLHARGVTRIFGNDSGPEWCTVGNPLSFFSHRRDRVSGRLAACIWLR
jgi:YfiH family protein